MQSVISLSGSLYCIHWRSPVKNIGGKPKYWGDKGLAMTDESVSQLLEGTCPGCPPKVYAYD